MTENSHLTPHCPDVGKARLAWSYRIVSLGILGGGPFILLKVGQIRRKTAKQAEIGLADFPTILPVLHARGQNSPDSRAMVVVGARFPWDMDNSSKIVCFVI
jgi:hypothetical protein